MNREKSWDKLNTRHSTLDKSIPKKGKHNNAVIKGLIYTKSMISGEGFRVTPSKEQYMTQCAIGSSAYTRPNLTIVGKKAVVYDIWFLITNI